MSQNKETNRAAYITTKGAYPLEVKPTPYTQPGPGEIVIRNCAIAVNPIDWFTQKPGNPKLNYISYPFVFGSDVAGEVVEVGPATSPDDAVFAVGDRVVGHAFGTDFRSKKATEGAFQLFTVLRVSLTAKIPDSVTFASASVLPLCLTTASTALFSPKYLGLQHPTSPRRESTGQVMVVWGASTSVGSNAVQLARSAGYEVIATASRKNFEYVRGLGATEVFDYRSGTVVQDIGRALEGKTCAGAVTVGHDSTYPCIDIIAAAKGKKFIAQISAPVSLEDAANPGWLGMAGVMGRFMWASAVIALKAVISGVKVQFVWGGDLVENPDLCRSVYNEYLPAALSSGEFIPAPEAQVVGHGLEKIQEAFDVCRKGVSAKKIVVTL
ncbi:zinc-binding dehydrogenase [Podospora australis]|uniref:Zinc-binding dehydrogenase n=1 Tax=Podospora australis TaxID=1536484 RepID=A0AAN6WLS4_9PEZI|nr:zinc-binding dehydrogenase [Podospora australis]